MIAFAHPLWLAALAIIPVIRWLHRWHMPVATIAVSALFLWQDAHDAADAGPQKKQPDVSWRRRALLSACIILALAQPFWRAQQLPLTIWLDDTASMFAVEDGTDRIATALARLDAALLESDARWSGRTLRSLTDPGLAWTYATASDFSAAVRPADSSRIPQLPAMTSLDGEHWLLTDGSSEAVRDWASSAAINHVIGVGSATENTAITRLAVRRSLDVGGRFGVLVAISNMGLREDTRTISVRIGEQPAAQIRMSLPPGETHYWRTRIAAIPGAITASLQAGDALAIDDMLSIDAGTLQAVATSVDTACGPGLQLALAEHPSLKIIPQDEVADLTVSCPDTAFASAPVSPGAHLRVLRAPSQRIAAIPVWSADRNLSQQLLLGSDYLRAATWPGPIDDLEAELLLRSGDQPLVTRSKNPVSQQLTIDTVIDLNDPDFIAGPEMPALVSVLVDLALDRALLDETAGVDRDPALSVIIPRDLHANSAGPAAMMTASATPFGWLFVAAAAMLLLLDLLLLTRRSFENRHA